MFPGVQKSTWNYDEVAQAWYFHRFYDFQPDLNTSNPEVQAEILKIMGFWLQLGVSGFRMDAVPFVIATQGRRHLKPSNSTTCCASFREFLSWREGDAIVLAEANVLPETIWNTSARRRAVADDVQLPGESGPVLCAGHRRQPTAAEIAESDENAFRDGQWAQFPPQSR